MKITQTSKTSLFAILFLAVSFLAPYAPAFAQACDASKTPASADCQYPGSSVCTVTNTSSHTGTCTSVSDCIPANGACAPGTTGGPATVTSPSGPTTNQTSSGPNTSTNPSGPNTTQTPRGPNTVQPASDGTSLHNPLNNVNSLQDLLAAILGAVVILGTIALVIALVWVGALFVFAQGQEEKIRDARGALMWTVIGGLVLLGAQAISTVIQSTVNGL